MSTNLPGKQGQEFLGSLMQLMPCARPLAAWPHDDGWPGVSRASSVCVLNECSLSPGEIHSSSPCGLLEEAWCALFSVF